MATMRSDKGSGLQGKIAQFFSDNPDEYLTIADAVVKWNATPKQIRDTICHIRHRGMRLRVVDSVLRVSA